MVMAPYLSLVLSVNTSTWSSLGRIINLLLRPQPKCAVVVHTHEVDR